MCGHRGCALLTPQAWRPALLVVHAPAAAIAHDAALIGAVLDRLLRCRKERVAAHRRALEAAATGRHAGVSAARHATLRLQPSSAPTRLLAALGLGGLFAALLGLAALATRQRRRAAPATAAAATTTATAAAAAPALAVRRLVLGAELRAVVVRVVVGAAIVVRVVVVVVVALVVRRQLGLGRLVRDARLGGETARAARRLSGRRCARRLGLGRGRLRLGLLAPADLGGEVEETELEQLFLTGETPNQRGRGGG